MKPLFAGKRVWFLLGLLLSLPTAYFVFIFLVKYVLGWNAPFQASYPLLQRYGIEEELGWNINLLILFGPLLALLMNLTVLVSGKLHSKAGEFKFSLSIRKSWPNLLLALACAFLLFILFVYLAGENCNCH